MAVSHNGELEIGRGTQLVLSALSTWVPFEMAILAGAISRYGVETALGYWLLTPIIIILSIVATIIIVFLVHLLVRGFAAFGIVVLSVLGILGNMGWVAWTVYTESARHNALGPEVLWIGLVVVASIMLCAVYLRDALLSSSAKILALMMAIVIPIAVFSIGLTIGTAHARNDDALGAAEYQREQSVLPAASVCGDGVCQAKCQDAAARSGACVAETPNTCPSDCDLVCVWKSTAGTNANEMPYACHLLIATVGTRTPLEYVTIGFVGAPGIDKTKYYACVTTHDCPPRHTCAPVYLEDSYGSRSMESVCTVNPIPNE